MITQVQNTERAKHEQISEAIRRLVIERYFKPGEKLPGERELALKFGVSEETIRSAKRSLIRQGILVSVNRSGTFIAEDALQPRIGVIFGHNWLAAPEAHFVRAVFSHIEELTHSEMQLRYFVDKSLNDPYAASRLIDELQQAGIETVFLHTNNPIIWRMCEERHVIHLTFGHVVEQIYEDMLQSAIMWLEKCNKNQIAVLGADVFGDLLAYKNFRINYHPEWHESWFCPHYPPGKYENIEGTENLGYEQFKFLWSLPQKPNGIIILDDILLKGAAYAMLELNVLPSRDFELISHSNKGINLFVPFRYTRLEIDPEEYAKKTLWGIKQLLTKPNIRITKTAVQFKIIESRE